MKLWMAALAAAALSAVTFAKQTALPGPGLGNELVGTWELKEKICDRPGHAVLKLDYSDDRSDTISVLHIQSARRGMLEEIHLGKHRSCTGKSEFAIEYPADGEMKLTQSEMLWDGQTNRDLASLGCQGEEGRRIRLLSYDYDDAGDLLKLKQKDPTRVCRSLVSIYHRR